MPRPVLLDADTVREEMTGLPGWTLSGDGRAITRKFRFRDFGEAFAFMARSALAAEKLDHHPDWRNSFRNVEVSLSTHDRGGLTALDFALARAMDGFAA